MNYSKLYDSIISNAKNLEIDRTTNKKNKTCYYEIHHILPKCLGGDNCKDNLVLLTAKEHFICHRLLCEMYPDNHKIFYAFWAMMRKGKGQYRYTPSSRTYEYARQQFSLLKSGKTFEELYGIENATRIKDKLKSNSYCLGKKWTERFDSIKQEQIKKKISESLSGENNDRYGKTWEEYYGKERAAEIKKNSGASRSGDKNYMFGKKLSADSIKKRTATRKLKRELDANYSKKKKNTNPTITCEYCNCEIKLILYNRFHYKGRCINGSPNWTKKE